MKISFGKTEFCVFSLDESEMSKETGLNVQGKVIKYNPKPKLLGVILDEMLKFDSYIENVKRKAYKSLDLLRKVRETEGINQKCMI